MQETTTDDGASHCRQCQGEIYKLVAYEITLTSLVTRLCPDCLERTKFYCTNCSNEVDAGIYVTVGLCNECLRIIDEANKRGVDINYTLTAGQKENPDDNSSRDAGNHN